MYHVAHLEFQLQDWQQRRLHWHKGRLKPFWTFTIGFEEAQAYRRERGGYLGGYLRKNQWKDLIVDVYI